MESPVHDQLNIHNNPLSQTCLYSLYVTCQTWNGTATDETVFDALGLKQRLTDLES